MGKKEKMDRKEKKTGIFCGYVETRVVTKMVVGIFQIEPERCLSFFLSFFSFGQRRWQQVDLLAPDAVLEQLLVAREHDLLDRVQRTHESFEQDLIGAAYGLVTDQVWADLHGRDDAFALA